MSLHEVKKAWQFFSDRSRLIQSRWEIVLPFYYPYLGIFHIAWTEWAYSILGIFDASTHANVLARVYLAYERLCEWFKVRLEVIIPWVSPAKDSFCRLEACDGALGLRWSALRQLIKLVEECICGFLVVRFVVDNRAFAMCLSTIVWKMEEWSNHGSAISGLLCSQVGALLVLAVVSNWWFLSVRLPVYFFCYVFYFLLEMDFLMRCY